MTPWVPPRVMSGLSPHHCPPTHPPRAPGAPRSCSCTCCASTQTGLRADLRPELPAGGRPHRTLNLMLAWGWQRAQHECPEFSATTSAGSPTSCTAATLLGLPESAGRRAPPPSRLLGRTLAVTFIVGTHAVALINQDFLTTSEAVSA